jgi:hypothetical protein
VGEAKFAGPDGPGKCARRARCGPWLGERRRGSVRCRVGRERVRAECEIVFRRVVRRGCSGHGCAGRCCGGRGRG